jgi:hypothetical protein
VIALEIWVAFAALWALASMLVFAWVIDSRLNRLRSQVRELRDQVEYLLREGGVDDA